LKIFNIDRLLESLTGYLETKIELFRLDLEDEIQKVIAKAIILVIVVICVFFALFLISISLSQFLNALFNSRFLGFLLVAVIYLAIGGVVYAKRESLNAQILDNIKSKKGKDEPENQLPDEE
tara:strand:- start:229 stop:594 length:366 start_codon:yes stop_codon:yes gene_type:complete